MSFLPKQAIVEFQEMYRLGGVVLTWEDATDKAESFISIYNKVVNGDDLKEKEETPMVNN
jgi:hypothetical protein